MTKLKRNDNAFTNNQFEILQEEIVFYETLYTSKNIESEDFSNSPFFNLENITPLSEDGKLSCEGAVGEKECFIALKEFKRTRHQVLTACQQNLTSFFGQRCALK